MIIELSIKRSRGLTMLEVLVIIVVLMVIGTLLLPPMARVHVKASRIDCVNNLKQMGIAYRVWENDNGGEFPPQQVGASNGMREILSSSAGAGQYAYLPYSIMGNELGQSPKIVICPSDERTPNTNFYPGIANAPASTNFHFGGIGTFDNTNVSYFCGVGAIDTFPQSILGGDRNLGNGGVIDITNGTIKKPEQDPYYGISGTTANPAYPCGADAIVNTNGRWSRSFVNRGDGRVGNGTQAVAWSAKMHSAGNTAGAGNILLGDGSVQQVTSASLRNNYLRNAGGLGNFAGVDTKFSATNGDIRLLFP